MTGSVPTKTTLTAEQAMERLAVQPEYDDGNGARPCVHTFVDGGFGLLGAHWGLEEVRDLIERNGAEESGDMAQAMNHGVVTYRDNGRPLFLETTSDA